MARHTGRCAIIIGAGPGGLAAATALQRIGWDVSVYERALRLDGAGSGLTLWPNATKALHTIGLLPTVSALTRTLESIAMRNWSGRTLFEHPFAALLDPPRFPSLALTRSELLEHLGAPVRERIRLGARAIDLTQRGERVAVKFADGLERDADLVVGADGLHSVVRERLVVPHALHRTGVDRNGDQQTSHADPLRFAGYTVWRGIAAIRFDQAVGTTWMGPARQFGLFPLAGDHTYWFAAGAEGGTAPGDSRAALSALLSGAPAPIAKVVASTEEAAIIQSDVYDRDPLPCWSVGRATLLGDAAHPAAPTLGQGACQAIEDAVMLAACLAAGDDVAAALQRYDARRVRRANAFVVEARRLGRMGLWKNPLACLLRDAMIAAMPLRVHRKQLARMFAFET